MQSWSCKAGDREDSWVCKDVHSAMRLLGRIDQLHFIFTYIIDVDFINVCVCYIHARVEGKCMRSFGSWAVKGESHFGEICKRIW